MNAREIFSSVARRRPDLVPLAGDFEKAFDLLRDALAGGGKVLTAGNGGSAADAEHIVGELLKSFRSTRPVREEVRDAVLAAFPNEGPDLVAHLEQPLPAIALTSHPAFATAFANDADASFAFAQQLLGLGRKGDAFIAISTSGNSKNVLHAVRLAKSLGIRVLGLTGKGGGALAPLCDVCLRVPEDKVYLIQEGHLPLYHALCWALEEHFFPGSLRDV